MRSEAIRKAFVHAGRLFTGACLAAFVFAIVLAAAPQWHERLHDAHHADHACVVTVLTTGSCEDFLHSAPAALPAEFSAIAVLRCEAPTAFSAQLESSILEHAPPVSA